MITTTTMTTVMATTMVMATTTTITDMLTVQVLMSHPNKQRLRRPPRPLPCLPARRCEPWDIRLLPRVATTMITTMRETT